mmetsp:Transcript_49844/g.116282  ORF Transcript_49844/g.116282 Transcript_49844/m.116282 type:complete len:267 (+) Transcript_49844:3221-4021(+)
MKDSILDSAEIARLVQTERGCGSSGPLAEPGEVEKGSAGLLFILHVPFCQAIASDEELPNFPRPRGLQLPFLDHGAVLIVGRIEDAEVHVGKGLSNRDHSAQAPRGEICHLEVRHSHACLSRSIEVVNLQVWQVAEKLLARGSHQGLTNCQDPLQGFLHLPCFLRIPLQIVDKFHQQRGDEAGAVHSPCADDVRYGTRIFMSSRVCNFQTASYAEASKEVLDRDVKDIRRLQQEHHIFIKSTVLHHGLSIESTASMWYHASFGLPC